MNKIANSHCNNKCKQRTYNRGLCWYLFTVKAGDWCLLTVSTLLTSLSELPFGAVIVSVWKLCAVFQQMVLLPHSNVNLVEEKREDSYVWWQCDDYLPPITPTVKLLHRVRHLLCFSCRSLRWTCLPAVILIHLELFTARLTLLAYLIS